jgi:Domain of unknown function (DUF3784)
MIPIIIFIILFLILGTIFSSGKASFLIAGYNTKSEEEKASFNETALSKFMGKTMFGISFSMVFWVLSEAFAIKWLFVFGLVLFIGIVIFTLIYVNTGNRFKK